MTLAMPNTLDAGSIADLAVAALHEEADLTPKPGLVDRRGPGAHRDMNLAMLHDSADSLHAALRECAYAAGELPLGPPLRARIGIIGRRGEHTMLTATNGVNTHRGALWALGLLSAALGAGASNSREAVAFAAQLAATPDPACDPRAGDSHGAKVRRRYRLSGALGEAQAGFPHVTEYALPAVQSGRPLDGLLAVIAHLDDTCLLHRGGPRGLAAVQHGAHAVIAAGGIGTAEGLQRFTALDRTCAARRLSPGGSGDLIAAALFLDPLFPDSLDIRTAVLCRP